MVIDLVLELFVCTTRFHAWQLDQEAAFATDSV